MVSGRRPACFPESCGPLPDLGTAAQRPPPRLGGVLCAVGGLSLASQSQVLRRAPPRLRPVTAGARSSQASPWHFPVRNFSEYLTFIHPCDTGIHAKNSDIVPRSPDGADEKAC